MARKKESLPTILSRPLVIDEAATLRDELRQTLTGRAKAIQLDLSQVTRCDTAGVQLLCAARRSAVNFGRTWRLINAPEAVLRACSEVGIQPEEIGL